MSTKFFSLAPGVASAISGRKYTDGAPIEYVMQETLTLAIQGWHNVSVGNRTAITAQLATAGWVEGEQSKPD